MTSHYIYDEWLRWQSEKLRRLFLAFRFQRCIPELFLSLPFLKSPSQTDKGCFLCVVLRFTLLVAAWICSDALWHFHRFGFDIVVLCHAEWPIFKNPILSGQSFRLRRICRNLKLNCTSNHLEMWLGSTLQKSCGVFLKSAVWICQKQICAGCLKRTLKQFICYEGTDTKNENTKLIIPVM